MSEDLEVTRKFAEDLLHGAEAISNYLKSLGFEVTTDGVYYAFRTKAWPISKHGKYLISTKSVLVRHAKKLTSFPATT